MLTTNSMENHGFKITYSPITENEQEGHEEDEETAAASAGCFTGCCFGFRRRSNQEISYLLHHQSTQRTERKESWVVEKIKKLKEFSEVIAGPKWKNFVRKVGKYCNPKKSKTTTATTTTTTTWMYSPNSYAMNFDQGPDYEEEDNYLFSFTSRFSGALYSDENKDDRLCDNLNESRHVTVKVVVM